MHLVSCLTPNYVPQALTYLNSISHILSIPVSVVLVDWCEEDRAQEEHLREVLDHVHFPHMALPKEHSYGMIQGGHFLDALPEVEDDEVVLLTDMDIKVQRDLTPEEIEEFEGMEDGVVAAGWNCGVGDRLEWEGMRIGYKAPDEDKGIPCFNCGVLGARVSTWKRIRVEYEKLYLDFYSQCSHRSRIQYLLNKIFHRLNLEVWVIPPHLHLNGHFLDSRGIPLIDPHSARIGEIWASGGQTVLLAHKLT